MNKYADRKRTLGTWSIFLVVLSLWDFAAAADERGQYTFDGWAGAPIRVFTTRPASLNADTPIVIVMHGQSRNADDYRDHWHDLAVARGFLLLVPEMSREKFPGSRAYNLGNLADEDGTAVPRALWSFSVPVALFEDARQRFGLSAETFAIYGHSAGAQFVHRFLMHVPDAPVSRVVAANAGWYTMPDFEIGFPYGLKGSSVDEAAVRRLLGLRLTVLLGDADTLTDQSNLRQSPEAKAQGPHRYARGHRFFKQGMHAAQDLETPFNWQLATVPGADHDDAKMAPTAVNHLLR